MGAQMGWELVLGTTAVGGALTWVKRRRRLAAAEEPLLEQTEVETPKLPGAV
jgi:hypothetical protein